MSFVDQIALLFQDILVYNLLLLLGAVVADFVLGVIVAGIITKDFSLRKLADFWVTTTGYKKLLAFAAALAIMFIHGDQFTHAVVAAMALTYAVAILPDIYDKLSALLFAGRLPFSTNLVQAPNPTATP